VPLGSAKGLMPSFSCFMLSSSCPKLAIGRTDARAEASIVKADCPNVSAGFILDPSLAAIYGRGKQVAGLA
jgi:hypothetical protein